MADLIARLGELGINLEELRTALNTPPPLWTSAGKDKWTRPGGWLQKTGGGYVELTDDGTVHRYKPGRDPKLPDGFPPSSTGSPLDHHHSDGSETVDPPADDAAAWQVLKRMA